MPLERPNLDHVDEAVRAYIEALEADLMTLRAQTPKKRSSAETSRPRIPDEPSEPETTVQIITISADGIAKRTPRHLYYRQRRSGMGVFDLETGEDYPPTILCEADEAEDVLIVTDQGRVFRQSVSAFPKTEVRGRGEALSEKIQLLQNEVVVAMLKAEAGLYLNMVSQRGWVRHVRNTYLNKSMIQGMRYHKVSDGGYVVGACWSSGSQDLFLASRLGKGIRFNEKQVPNSGVLGMRVDPDDVMVAIAATSDDGGVLLISDDGKGTIRQMAGFRKNKAPSAGGKVAMKTDALINALSVSAGQDVFIASRLSKVIRFAADEIPAKTGVVQGVNCMTLRADAVTAFAVSENIPAEA